MSTHEKEIRDGTRFGFGDNWKAYLETLDQDRIEQAEKSLRDMLRVDDLQGNTFLDAGCGSGLFSLAARRMGAKVLSFDFDPSSVWCAGELRRRYFPDDADWQVMEGSVLDPEFLENLGQFDVVYSWGVLHHTGAMWQAIENVSGCVASGGEYFISIYNDQGPASRYWLVVKKAYNRNRFLRGLMLAVHVPYFAGIAVAAGLVEKRNPLARFTGYRNQRGMSIWHDWVDWLGGLPFEVARTEEIFNFCRDLGFSLENLITTNRMGTNQLVLRKNT